MLTSKCFYKKEAVHWDQNGCNATCNYGMYVWKSRKIETKNKVWQFQPWKIWCSDRNPRFHCRLCFKNYKLLIEDFEKNQSLGTVWTSITFTINRTSHLVGPIKTAVQQLELGDFLLTKTFDEGVAGRNQVGSFGEKPVWKSTWNQYYSAFGILSLSDFQCKEQYPSFE